MHGCDEDVVQSGVGASGDDHQTKTHAGVSRRYEVGLKQGLKDAGRRECHDDTQIDNGVVYQDIGSSQKTGNRRSEQDRKNDQYDAEGHAEQDELGQALTGSFGIAFTQVFTDDRIASGGKHSADGNGQRDDRKDDVERR